MESSVIIRDETERDHDDIRKVHLAAFLEDGPGRLVDDLRRSGDATISLVAESESSIVGHVLFSRIEAPMRALIMAPVGIGPNLHGAGIGSALVRAGIARAEAAGWEVVFVLGSPDYDGRFGFAADAAAGYTGPYGGPSFMALLFKDGVPENGRLAFPAAFDEDIKSHVTKRQAER
jgi:putative acetyltransferase